MRHVPPSCPPSLVDDNPTDACPLRSEWTLRSAFTQPGGRVRASSNAHRLKGDVWVRSPETSRAPPCGRRATPQPPTRARLAVVDTGASIRALVLVLVLVLVPGPGPGPVLVPGPGPGSGSGSGSRSGSPPEGSRPAPIGCQVPVPVQLCGTRHRATGRHRPIGGPRAGTIPCRTCPAASRSDGAARQHEGAPRWPGGTSDRGGTRPCA